MTPLPPDDCAAITDSVRRLLAERHAFGAGRKADVNVGPDALPPLWRDLADIGLCGLMIESAHGGIEAAEADVVQVQQVLGAALAVSPWLQNLLCAQLVRRIAEPALRDALLPALADGSRALAWLDLATGTTAHTAQARPQAEGWALDGDCAAAPFAAAVSDLLVTAWQADGTLGCFLVDPRGAGVALVPHRLVDGSWSATVRLRAAAARRLAGHGGDEPGDGAKAAGNASAAAHVQAVRALALAGLCAEAAALGEAALAATVQHLRVRQQFGQPLADYQALRHRVAEMYVALEQARSAGTLALEACEAWRDPDAAADAQRLGAQAQLVMAESVTWLLQQAIQLHGGMGMTQDLPVGHFYRRMLVINALTGGASAAARGLAARAVHAAGSVHAD